MSSRKRSLICRSLPLQIHFNYTANKIESRTANTHKDKTKQTNTTTTKKSLQYENTGPGVIGTVKKYYRLSALTEILASIIAGLIFKSFQNEI